jgi:hypothetical protein
MKRWTIYCHVLIFDGRRYIGLTSHTMMHRWNQHCSQAKNLKGSRSHFINAIRKYGKDAFSHEVLAQSWDLENANATEEILIEQENTRNPEFGFNLAKGGSHVPHPIRRNPWNDPKFREKALVNLNKLNDSLTSQQRSVYSKAAWGEPEYRKNAVLRSKAQWQDPKIRSKNMIASKAGLNTSESKTKRSSSAKAQWADPVARANGILATRAKWKDGEIRKKLKNKWMDSDFREKCLPNLLNYHNARSIEAANKTHCKNGHSLTDDNVYRIDGLRICIICESDRKKRVVREKRQAVTHCSKGHEFTPENTRIDWQGTKKCIECTSLCKNGHLKSGENIYLDGKYERCLICVRNNWKKKKRRIHRMGIVQ